MIRPPLFYTCPIGRPSQTSPLRDLSQIIQ
jgi:hypothetical protein